MTGDQLEQQKKYTEYYFIGLNRILFVFTFADTPPFEFNEGNPAFLPLPAVSVQ